MRYICFLLLLVLVGCPDQNARHFQISMRSPIWEPAIEDFVLKEPVIQKEEAKKLFDSFKSVEVTASGRNYGYTQGGFVKVVLEPDQFKIAIEDSLKHSKWFNAQSGKYHLHADIIYIERDVSTTLQKNAFTLKALYTVSENGKQIYQQEEFTRQRGPDSEKVDLSPQFKMELATQKNIRNFMNHFLKEYKNEKVN